jgi:putative phosphoribosyl transferase
VAGEIEKMVDEFVCLETPVDFAAVGTYYHDFTQVSDEAVVGLLARAAG